MQGNKTATFTAAFNNLATTDAAVPNLWDDRFQILLNNDAVLEERARKLEQGESPARSVPTYNSAAAVRAINGMLEGFVIYRPDFGVYRYYAARSDAELQPWVLRPDNGIGRWVLDMVPRALLGVPNGVPTLDAQGFLAQALPAGAVGADSLAPKSVTQAKIADFTVDDSVAIGGNVGTLTQVLNTVANKLKAITGKPGWTGSPDVDLGTLNAKAARIDRTQTWTAQQNFGNATFTGTLVIPVL